VGFRGAVPCKDVTRYLANWVRVAIVRGAHTAAFAIGQMHDLALHQSQQRC
jgi:hypothetical protein